jgi:hypothetical protein
MPAANPLPWSLYTELVVGRGHPNFTDVDNRALRQLLTSSGYGPDNNFTGFAGPVFHPKAYGAAFDGVTDDTTALNLCIADACVVPGSTVALPSGTTIVSQLVGVAGATFLRIMGNGPSTVVKLLAGATTNPIFMTGLSSFVLENLIVDGNKANCPSALNGVRSDCDDTYIHNVLFQNALLDGVFWNPVASTQRNRFHVIGCRFLNVGQYGIAVQSGNNITIVGNVAEGCGTGLVDLEPTTASASVTDFVIIGNTVRNSGSAIGSNGAIQAYGTNGTFPSVSRGVIAGNTIYGGAQHGIRCGDVENVSVCNNHVAMNSFHGIYFSAATGNLFNRCSDNQVYDCGTGAANTYDGIFLSVFRDGAVTGNLVTDDQGKHRYHLHIDSASQRITRRTNSLTRTAQTAPLLDQSTDTGQGTAVLVAGTVTVTTSMVQAADTILLTTVVPGGTVGFLRVSAIVAGTSFTITSSSAADTSTVAWEIGH